MKRVVTILLLLVMLTQAFSKVLITINYQANKDYIAAFLCINKNEPQLHCEGHCYLRKELKKAEQKENPVSGQHQKQQLDITLYYQSLYSLATVKTTPEKITFSLLKIGAARSRQIAFFHPPQSAV